MKDHSKYNAYRLAYYHKHKNDPKYMEKRKAAVERYQSKNRERINAQRMANRGKMKEEYAADRERLQAARKETGISCQELGEELGVSKQYVSQIFLQFGYKHTIRLYETMVRICKRRLEAAEKALEVERELRGI